MLNRYPGPTLRALELLQQKAFRERLGDIGFVMAITQEWVTAAAARKEKAKGGDEE